VGFKVVEHVHRLNIRDYLEIYRLLCPKTTAFVGVERGGAKIRQAFELDRPVGDG